MEATEDSHKNIQVVCRFRPFTETELEFSLDPLYTLSEDSKTVLIIPQLNYNEPLSFRFDHIFDSDSTQMEIYSMAAFPIVEAVMQGFNGTVLAYGQTSSGKTYTMTGPDIDEYATMGMIPRMVNSIFEQIENSGNWIEYSVKLSYFEIYLEKIHDLLDIEKRNLKIHENKTRGIFISELSEIYVTSAEEVFTWMKIGLENRKVAFTNMNQFSSRSHSLFSLTINQMNHRDYVSKTGKLYLVDLAGSEKVSKINPIMARLEETKNINKSLTMLGKVINSLTDNKSTHIPYRDSKLTRVLQDSLGGNSKTSLVITCSPSAVNEAETISTLRFGIRAKCVKNKPKVNRDFTIAELKIMLNRCKEELAKRDKRIMMLEEENLEIRKGLDSAKTRGSDIGLGTAENDEESDLDDAKNEESEVRNEETGSGLTDAKHERIYSAISDVRIEGIDNVLNDVRIEGIDSVLNYFKAERVESALNSVKNEGIDSRERGDITFNYESKGFEEDLIVAELEDMRIKLEEQANVVSKLEFELSLKNAELARQTALSDVLSTKYKESKQKIKEHEKALQDRSENIEKSEVTQLTLEKEVLRANSRVLELEQRINEIIVNSNSHALTSNKSGIEELKKMLNTEKELNSASNKEITNLKTSLQQILSSKTKDFTIQQVVREQISRTERDKWGDEKKELFQELKTRINRIVELELALEDSRQAYFNLEMMMSEGERALKRKTEILERNLEQVNLMYHNLISQNSQISVEKTLAEKRLSRVNETIKNLNTEVEKFKELFENSEQKCLVLSAQLEHLQRYKGKNKSFSENCLKTIHGRQV